MTKALADDTRVERASLLARAWDVVACSNKAVCVTTAVVAVLGTVLVLSGCAPLAPTSSTPGELNVVATTTQVADFAKNVAGTAANVVGLVQANQSVHTFDPSARNLLDLSHADVLVTNGVNLEAWLSDAITASGFQGTVIDTSTGVTLLPSVEASGTNDPHIWTNPLNAIIMVKNIAAAFAAAEPTRAATFEANASAYEAKLTALNAWVLSNMDQVPAAQRLMVTNHDAFTYFYKAFGITFVGAIIPSLDDNAEPSAAELDTLISAIRSSGAKAVFSEASLSPKLAQTIGDEAGVKVYSGDDALYSDSLGAPGTSGATYISATIHNVTVLMDSWGFAALPLPAAVTS